MYVELVRSGEFRFYYSQKNFTDPILFLHTLDDFQKKLTKEHWK